MSRRTSFIPVCLLASTNVWSAASFDITGHVDWTTWSVTQGGSELSMVNASVLNYTHAHVSDDHAYVIGDNYVSPSAYGPAADPWVDVSADVVHPVGEAHASTDSDSMNVSTSSLNYYTNTDSTNTDSRFTETGSIAKRRIPRYELNNSTDLITISAAYSMTGMLSTDDPGDIVSTSNTFFDIMGLLLDSGANSIMNQVNVDYRPNYTVSNGDDLSYADGGILTLTLDPALLDLSGVPTYLLIRAELRAYGRAVTEEGTSAPEQPTGVPMVPPLLLIGLGLAAWGGSTWNTQEQAGA